MQLIVNNDFTDPKLIFKTKAPAYEVESIPRRIYSFEDVPSIFLNSEIFGNRIDYLLRNMTCNNFNSIYSEFCQAVINDMDIHLKHFDLKDSGSFYKCKSNRKPFWDAELTEGWHQMKNKEKLFRQHKGPWQERNELRKSLLNVRKTFDRCLASKEKQFNRSKVLIIDSYSKNNHKLFWDQIHKLGPNSKKMQKVPNVVRINANLTSDKDQVKQKWFSDFTMLYTGPSVGLNQCSVHNVFYEDILHRIRDREYFMECDGYVENEFLNVDISFDEILKIVKALKLKKSVRYDKVPKL